MLGLRITDAQVEFAGTVEQAIVVVETDTAGDVAGLAIRAGGAIVGFLVLRRRTALGGWAPDGAAALTAMRIDLDHQGRGIGSGALQAVAAWVAAEWPACEVLALQVDVGNEAGRGAYERAGFAVSGPPATGRIGAVLTMVRPISRPTGPSPRRRPG